MSIYIHFESDINKWSNSNPIRDDTINLTNDKSS